MQAKYELLSNLINKTILYNGLLMKVQKYNNRNFYGFLYETDRNVTFDNNIISQTCEYSINYKHFINKLEKKATRFRIKDFYDFKYKIINENKIDNMYIINNLKYDEVESTKMHKKYNRTELKNNLNQFTLKQKLYYKIRNINSVSDPTKKIKLIENFLNTKEHTIKPLMKILLDEITNEKNDGINYYDTYETF
jgi:hypothetical protein